MFTFFPVERRSISGQFDCTNDNVLPENTGGINRNYKDSLHSHLYYPW